MLTKLYERMYFGEKEWKMSDAPKTYRKKDLNDIVAFKLEVKLIIVMSKFSKIEKQKILFLKII